MPVVGLNLNSITAKKMEDYNGPFRVGHKTSIKEVNEMDMKALGKKGLKMDFEFSTAYNTEDKRKFAEIKMEGNVIFLADNPAEILMTWKKEKKLPDDVNLQAINSVIRKCVTKTITLSEEISLPPPIPIPIAKGGAAQPQGEAQPQQPAAQQQPGKPAEGTSQAAQKEEKTKEGGPDESRYIG